MAERFDVAVVGAGAVGAAAAYHAARGGRRVVLLEQFELGHNRGSSHGESRIIRHSYTSTDYATLAPPAFEMWRELERESGANLLTMTGGIDLGRATNPAMLACRDALTTAGFGSVWLEGAEARSYVPQFNMPDDWAVLWQSGAGILNAGRCVRTLAAQSIAYGATVLERAKVERIEPGTRSTHLVCTREGANFEIEARSVIVAAGPWAGKLFGGLGFPRDLRVTHQQVVYFPVEDDSLWRLGRCPIYIAHGRAGFYGFPVCERPGFIKVAIELETTIEDPDEAPREPHPEALDQLSATVARLFRGIRPDPAEVVTCRYTETPDRDFIIDRHPEYPGIVLASPCSGHGFKFSILTGKLAAELAASPAGDYSSALWRERFALEKKASAAGALATEWRD